MQRAVRLPVDHDRMAYGLAGTLRLSLPTSPQQEVWPIFRGPPEFFECNPNPDSLDAVRSDLASQTDVKRLLHAVVLQTHVTAVTRDATRARHGPTILTRRTRARTLTITRRDQP